jgi:hypothetical protein
MTDNARDETLADPTEADGLAEWAISRWNAEVANRPLNNVHRRALDTTWRQVIRHGGGDPDVLLGPSHDDLVADSPAPPATDTGLREALEPFAQIEFSFDGYSFEMADIVFEGKVLATVNTTSDHARLSQAVKLARAALSRPLHVADTREQIIEECAKVAQEALGGYVCPYGRDKPGDPTWGHTDSDICPVCGKNGNDAAQGCHDTVSGRIAAKIRALKKETLSQSRPETGDSNHHVCWGAPCHPYHAVSAVNKKHPGDVT